MVFLLFIFLISISFAQWGVKNQITERHDNGKAKVILKLKGNLDLNQMKHHCSQSHHWDQPLIEDAQYQLP